MGPESVKREAEENGHEIACNLGPSAENSPGTDMVCLASPVQSTHRQGQSNREAGEKGIFKIDVLVSKMGG
jgi:hypothetical protein